MSLTVAVNPPNQPTNVISQAIAWMLQGHKIALITLINIQGSAPYPLGSQMLVNDQGQSVGQITGGCAETALTEHAVMAIDQGTNESERYGLNSPYFDIQLPCGSGIDVYFDVTSSLHDYEIIAQELISRTKVSQTILTNIGSMEKIYAPTPRLLVFGQGPIQIHLNKLAQESGFEVICFAQNEAQVNALQQAGVLATMLPNSYVELVKLCDRDTGVVSLFHDHEIEIDLLASLLQSQVFYIGALGSKATQAIRLRTLATMGIAPALLQTIHGPVGLDIGAITPAQIAISILAQVIQEYQKTFTEKK